MISSITKLFKTFPPTFWIASGFEFFEQLAVSATLVVLAIFINEKLRLNGEVEFFLEWFLITFCIMSPIAGVLADKYGFQKTLFACFAFFAVGYFTIGLSVSVMGKDSTEAFDVQKCLLIGLWLMAIGSSLIRPCIVGTLARTLPEKSLGLGYSIYYTLITISGVTGMWIGVIIQRTYSVAFVLFMAVSVALLLMILSLLFFKEPPDDGSKKKSFDKVLGDTMLVFQNKRFIFYFIIFSIFWILHYLLILHNFTTVLFLFVLSGFWIMFYLVFVRSIRFLLFILIFSGPQVMFHLVSSHA